MARKYLDYDGLLYFWTLIKTKLSGKVDKEDGKGLSTNDYTTDEKTKLAGIATGANKTTVDSSLSSSSTNPVQNKVINTALSGKVDAEDGKGLSTNDYTTDEKTKLAGIATGAEVNQNAFSTVKVAGTSLAADSKTDTLTITAGNNITLTPTASSDSFSIAATDTTYSAATQSAEGLMSAADKTKLDGIATGATNITVDSALSSTSTNPLENKAINTALDKKANLASPTLTGTPKAPTASAGTNTTQIATTAFVTTAVANAIGQVTSISFSVVTSLPETGTNGVIYLVAHSHGTGDAYDEYIWLSDSSSYEKIGNTDVDLSGYVLSADLVAITNTEIDTIVAA